MSSRFFEKSVQVDKGIQGCEQDNRFEIEYYLLESEMNDSDQGVLQKTYGIEITKKMNDGFTENKRIEGIYTSKRKVQELISLLAANSVTPLSLPYILDDILGA